MLPYTLAIALLAVAAVLVHRRRSAARPTLDDDMIRTIEEGGRIEVDEPLDLDHIAEEEQRFLDEERWDSADEW